MFPRTTTKGFTLIELLVVIGIVGILSSIVLVSVNDARKKARDARRAEDMHQIYTVLHMYYTTYGCLPRPGSTVCAAGDSNAGGWDYSSQGSFLSFLVAAGLFSKVPVDPINNMTGDGSPPNSYAYRYYCYTGGSNPGLHLGYWKESGGYVNKATWGTTNWSDKTFLCK